jgi:hypothetical protein
MHRQVTKKVVDEWWREDKDPLYGGEEEIAYPLRRALYTPTLISLQMEAQHMQRHTEKV